MTKVTLEKKATEAYKDQRAKQARRVNKVFREYRDRLVVMV